METESPDGAAHAAKRIRGGPDNLYPLRPQPSHFPRLVSAVKDAGAALTILAAVGFIVSVAVNESVFRFWGLSFLGLATPPEVLSNGVQALLDLIVFWAPGLYAYAIVRYNTHDTTVGWLSLYAFPFFLADLVLIPFGLGSSLLLVAIVGWWSGICHGWRRGHGGVHALSAFLALISVWGTIAYLPLRAFQLSRFGYLWSPQYLTAPNLNNPNCARRVLWVGDRAVVVNCGPSNRDRKIVVLLDRGGAKIDGNPKAVITSK